jgi:hypothetical protein
VDMETAAGTGTVSDSPTPSDVGTGDAAAGASGLASGFASGLAAGAVDSSGRRQTKDVVLVKQVNDEDIGFEVAGGSGTGQPPTVSYVRPGGKAAGKLQIGDVLLAVNKRDLADGTNQDIVGLIRRSGPELTISYVRPSESSLLELFPMAAGSSMGDLAETVDDSEGRSSVPPLLSGSRSAGSSAWLQPMKTADGSSSTVAAASGLAKAMGSGNFGSPAPLLAPQLLGLAKQQRHSHSSLVSQASSVMSDVRHLSTVSAAEPLQLPVYYWGRYEVVEWLRIHGLDQHQRAFLKKKVDGIDLLQMQLPGLEKIGLKGAEAAHFLELTQQLRTSFSLPKAVHWSVADVADWANHQEALGNNVSRVFAKKKVDGRELIRLLPSSLEKMRIKDETL